MFLQLLLCHLTSGLIINEERLKVVNKSLCETYSEKLKKKKKWTQFSKISVSCLAYILVLTSLRETTKESKDNEEMNWTSLRIWCHTTLEQPLLRYCIVKKIPTEWIIFRKWTTNVMHMIYYLLCHLPSAPITLNPFLLWVTWNWIWDWIEVYTHNNQLNNSQTRVHNTAGAKVTMS